MSNSKPFFLVILLIVLLSACGGDAIPQIPASATPEISAATSLEVTSQVASPIVSSTSDPTTAQATATLPAVFDLTRTKDNPITDAQQIIEILEVLEGIQRAQPVPPGWYLRTSIDLNDPENPERSYSLFHVIGDNLNCDLAMQFKLSPDGNILWRMVRDYGTAIYTRPGSSVTLDIGSRNDNICDQPHSPLSFFIDYSDAFSNMVTYSLSDEAIDHNGGYSFSAWFEIENDKPLFILQEKTENIQAGYITDPDSNGWVGINSEESLETYAIDTGIAIGVQTAYRLVNNTIINRTVHTQRDYYGEMTDLPVEVLDYLEEALLLYDELQLP